jgi:hypothetical protein
LIESPAVTVVPEKNRAPGMVNVVPANPLVGTDVVAHTAYV